MAVSANPEQLRHLRDARAAMLEGNEAEARRYIAAFVRMGGRRQYAERALGPPHKRIVGQVVLPSEVRGGLGTTRPRAG